MRLIGSLTSPYVRKVRVVLAEKRLDYRLEPEDPWSPQTRIHDANPLGKVPCLVLEGGDSLYDSRVIVEYVDTLSPLSRLIPERGRERAEVRNWEALADGVLDAAVAVRMEQVWSGRSAEQRSQAWIDRQFLKIDRALAVAAGSLRDQPWLAGQHISLADLAVGCATAYLDFRFPQHPWRARHPELARFSDKLNARPSFQQTAPPTA